MSVLPGNNNWLEYEQGLVKGLCNRIFFFIKVAYLRNFSNVEAEVFCKVEPHKLRHSDVEMAYKQ